ncbi:methyltransferase domain-containing protein, partial [Flavimaricola marinus]|uniref:methyltransferase domain-containing protein n=1 Tax=Flavimaricola marinus TaxID=1819565 RepID=UPI001055042B
DGVTNVPAYLGEYHSDLADNSFDVVFSVSVVEHVPHTATVAFIDDLLRILKPGGVCYHAMSMYVGDSVDPANQRKLDTYAGWLSRPDVSPMEETTATQPLFQSNMGTNPDLTMWKWGQTNATLTEMRCASQSVSLFMGFRKAGS